MSAVETLPQLGQFNLGKGGVGASATVNAMLLANANRINDREFHVSAPALSACCIDERVDENGNRLFLAKVAGGPLSIVYALRLSGVERYADMDELQLVDYVMQVLREKNIIQHFAVHDDDHQGVCGCGACAKAHDVDNEINDNFSAISAAYQALTSQQPLASIVQQSAAAMDVGFFADDRIGVLTRAEDGGAQGEKLVGNHDGSLIILNYVPQTTVDTGALRRADIKAFVVDYWVFDGLAELFTENDDEKSLVVQSLWAYNLGTATVLCSSNILIVKM